MANCVEHKRNPSSNRTRTRSFWEIRHIFIYIYINIYKNNIYIFTHEKQTWNKTRIRDDKERRSYSVVEKIKDRPFGVFLYVQRVNAYRYNKENGYIPQHYEDIFVEKKNTSTKKITKIYRAL